jgi:hypothetical protein
MPLTEEQTRLAVIIDTHVREVLAQGGGDEALLMSMADSMGTFTQLLDTCTSAEMDALCDRYDGLYRYAKLLEMLAGGIADGSIPVPDNRLRVFRSANTAHLGRGVGQERWWRG